MGKMVAHKSLRKNFVRSLVEQVFAFHPDMTAKERDESIPICMSAIALLIGLALTFAGVLSWVVSR